MKLLQNATKNCFEVWQNVFQIDYVRHFKVSQMFKTATKQLYIRTHTITCQNMIS